MRQSEQGRHIGRPVVANHLIAPSKCNRAEAMSDFGFLVHFPRHRTSPSCSNPEEQELFYALIDRSAALQCEQEKNLPRANDALGPVKSMG